MKFSLFFIAILATITGLPISMHPKNLVASSDNADPEAIASLQEYVNTLITEGEDERARLVGLRDAAQAVLDQESADLVAAEENLKAAQDIHTAKEGVVAEKAADEAAKGDIRASKLAIKNQKKSVLDSATEFEATEQERLDKERTLFEKVKTLLKGVRASERRLLNIAALDQALAFVNAALLEKSDAVNQALALLQTTDDADPAQVDEALKLLDDLIAAGEAERQSAVDALAKAQKEYDEASAIHDDAVAVHTLAEGALEAANLELGTAKSVLTLRNNEHKAAVDDKSTATDALNAAQDHLDVQNARIDSEKLDLEMIRDLLGKLE